MTANSSSVACRPRWTFGVQGSQRQRCRWGVFFRRSGKSPADFRFDPARVTAPDIL